MNHTCISTSILCSPHSCKVEPHSGTGGAQEGPPGLGSAHPELPAGVWRDQEPDTGQAQGTVGFMAMVKIF